MSTALTIAFMFCGRGLNVKSLYINTSSAVFLPAVSVCQFQPQTNECHEYLETNLRWSKRDRGRLQISSPLFCISNAQLILWRGRPAHIPAHLEPPTNQRLQIEPALWFWFLVGHCLQFSYVTAHWCSLYVFFPQRCKLNEVTRLKLSFELVD